MTNPVGALREEEISFDGRDARLRGVLVQPRPAALPVPGVVVFPDVRGVSDLHRRAAHRLAGAGFAALLLDPYSREGAPDLPDMDAVMRWIAALDEARVLADVADTAGHLRALPAVAGRPVGILGFCLGGQYALAAACGDAGFAACVSFYGMLRHERSDRRPRTPLDVAGGLACPFLGLYGADDPLVAPPDRAELEAIFRRDRRTFEMHVFGGAGHAFANDTRPADHRPRAAAVAWRLAIDFLGDALAPAPRATGGDGAPPRP